MLEDYDKAIRIFVLSVLSIKKGKTMTYGVLMPHYIRANV